MKKKYIAYMAVVLLLLSLVPNINVSAKEQLPSPTMSSADKSWANTTGDWDWENPDNWNPVTVPDNDEIAQFDASNTTSDCWINTTQATNDLTGIYFEEDYTGTLWINAEQGINNDIWINMTGGTIDAPSPVNITIGQLNMSGGTIGNNVMLNVTSLKVTGGSLNSRHVRIFNMTTTNLQTNQELENLTVLFGDVRLSQDTKLNGNLTVDSYTTIATHFRIEEYKFECEGFNIVNTGTTVDVHTRDGGDFWINKNLLIGNLGGSRVSFGTPDTNYNLTVNGTFSANGGTYTTFPTNDGGWAVDIYKMVMQETAVVNNSDSQSAFDYVDIEDSAYLNISDGQIAPRYYLNLTGGTLGYDDGSPHSSYWIQMIEEGRFYCDATWVAEDYSYSPIYIGPNAVIETSANDVRIAPEEEYDYAIFIENNTREMTFDYLEINGAGSSYRVGSGIKMSNCSGSKTFTNVSVHNSSYALYTTNVTDLTIENMKNYNNSDSVIETISSSFTIKNSTLLMLHNTTKNETVTHGSFAGCTDTLTELNVTNVLEVGQGSTIYTETVDYIVDNNTLDWSPAGAEPAPDSSYWVRYECRESVGTVVEDGSDSDVTFLNTTWDLYENDDWMEFSINNYTIDWFINVHIIDENHNDMDNTAFTIESSESGECLVSTGSDGWYRYFIATERKSVSGTPTSYNPWYLNVTSLSGYENAYKTTSVGSGSQTVEIVLYKTTDSTGTTSTLDSATQLVAQFIPVIAVIAILGLIIGVFKKFSDGEGGSDSGGYN